MNGGYWIDQPGCLGDILYTTKVGVEHSKRGRTVWPIYQHMWDNGISRLLTGMQWVPAGVQMEPNMTVIPMSQEPILENKYKIAGIDPLGYQRHIIYRRDENLEQALRDAVGLKPGDPFILLNDEYSFNKHHHGVEKLLPQGYDGKIIKMSVIPGVTIFDWSWMFENAEEIHTVETAINYVIDTLDIKAKRLVAHPRNTRTRSVVGHLFHAPWEWIDWPIDEWRNLVPDEAELQR